MNHLLILTFLFVTSCSSFNSINDSNVSGPQNTNSGDCQQDKNIKEDKNNEAQKYGNQIEGSLTSHEEITGNELPPKEFIDNLIFNNSLNYTPKNQSMNSHYSQIKYCPYISLK